MRSTPTEFGEVSLVCKNNRTLFDGIAWWSTVDLEASTFNCGDERSLLRGQQYGRTPANVRAPAKARFCRKEIRALEVDAPGSDPSDVSWSAIEYGISETWRSTLRLSTVQCMTMPDAAADQLKQAVETQHGGTATHVQSVPVHQSQNGKTIWNGAVQVYDLVNSPSGATRAYAWSYGRADGRRELITVLRTGAVNGPRDAVAAAMMRQ